MKIDFWDLTSCHLTFLFLLSFPFPSRYASPRLVTLVSDRLRRRNGVSDGVWRERDEWEETREWGELMPRERSKGNIIQPLGRECSCRSASPFSLLSSSLPVSSPPYHPARTGPFGTRWERRWCERHGKEMGTRRKRPTFPRSHLVPSSYSRVSMWRELEEINRVTWDPRNERRERRRDECGAVGLFTFPSHSHPSLPRVTHSAAPHSLHSSVREMNGVRRTVTTRGESEKKPRGRDTTRLGKTRERCGEDTIRAVSLT